MTGEAWNEIMHDLAKNSDSFGRIDGTPCVSQLSIDSGKVFDLLSSKCIISDTNPAAPLQCGDSAMAYLYFVSYTLFITFIVLNLVVAVILEGFEDSSNSTEDEVVNLAIDNWKTIDPDYHLTLTEAKAMEFIDLLEKLVYEEDTPERAIAESIVLTETEKKFLKLKMDGDDHISFAGVMHGALRQILLKGVESVEDRVKMMEEIRQVENQIR